jgi:hypothetical protein
MIDAIGAAIGSKRSIIGAPRRSHGAEANNDAEEILVRVQSWAGSRTAARLWFRSQAIAALGDQTAEALVRTGQARLVRQYLDGIAAGGYA